MQIKQIEIKFIEKLRNKDVVEEIRKNIGDLQNIDDKIAEYKNPEIRKNLSKLKNSCTFYRRIRGDGNCFYRAVFYQYLESLYKENKVKLLTKHIQRINEMKFQEFYDIPTRYLDIYNNQNSLKNVLCIGFKFLYMYRKASNFQNILRNFFNEIQEFDFAIILYLRQISVIEFDQNEMIPLLYNTEKERQEERIRLLTYGEEAQYSNLDMVYNALQINVDIHSVTNVQYTCINYGSEGIKLNLFFRPGHYDCCYQIEDNNNNQENNEKVTEQEMQTNNQEIKIIPEKIVSKLEQIKDQAKEIKDNQKKQFEQNMNQYLQESEKKHQEQINLLKEEYNNNKEQQQIDKQINNVSEFNVVQNQTNNDGNDDIPIYDQDQNNEEKPNINNYNRQKLSDELEQQLNVQENNNNDDDNNNKDQIMEKQPIEEEEYEIIYYYKNNSEESQEDIIKYEQ